MCSMTARSSIPARRRSSRQTRTGSAPWRAPAQRIGVCRSNRLIMDDGEWPQGAAAAGEDAMKTTMGRLAAICGVVIGLIVIGLAGGAPAAAQTVQIGGILSYSRPTASIAEQLGNASQLNAKGHDKDLPAG